MWVDHAAELLEVIGDDVRTLERALAAIREQGDPLRPRRRAEMIMHLKYACFALGEVVDLLPSRLTGEREEDDAPAAEGDPAVVVEAPRR
jgi:hypothetical protein